MRESADQRSTRTLHHKERWCESIDREIKAGLRGPLPPFDPPTSGAPLESPDSSHLLHLLPPQLPLYPAVRCWDAECTLSDSADSEKQRVKVQRSALNLQYDPCGLHMTPVSTAELCFLLGPLVFSLSIHSDSSFYVFFSAWNIFCNLIPVL